jgi:LCP family protein required for cell wall assembly
MIRQYEPTTTKKAFGAIWYTLVCASVLTGACVAGWFGRSGFSVWKVISLPKPQEAFSSDAQTFLILGCDEDYTAKSYEGRLYTGEAGATHTPDSTTQQKGAARSDMMLVARMDFAKGEITGVSIPRDTWCQLPGQEGHRINAYHNIAPPGQENDLTKQAVESLLGVQIDKVIVINFDSMQKLVDMMGGVWVTVPKKMDYDDNAGQLHVHLKAGYQKLNGYDAMGYVRFRHSNDKKLTETDFQRQQREKDMLVGFKRAAEENKSHLPDIARAGREVLGDSLTDDQVLALAGFARGLKDQKIRMGVVPTRARAKGSVLDLDVAKLPQVLQEYNLGDYATRVTQR